MKYTLVSILFLFLFHPLLAKITSEQKAVLKETIEKYAYKNFTSDRVYNYEFQETIFYSQPNINPVQVTSKYWIGLNDHLFMETDLFQYIIMNKAIYMVDHSALTLNTYSKPKLNQEKNPLSSLELILEYLDSCEIQTDKLSNYIYAFKYIRKDEVTREITASEVISICINPKTKELLYTDIRTNQTDSEFSGKRIELIKFTNTSIDQLPTPIQLVFMEKTSELLSFYEQKSYKLLNALNQKL